MADSLMGAIAPFWTLVAFVVALGVIVTIHEFGHYIVARWSGVGAEVFSIGMGPRIWGRRDKRGTLWQIAALPIGGYVRFKGDTDAASATSDTAGMTPAERRQTLEGAPLWARVATVAAGPVFNFALSFAIFASLIWWQGMPQERPIVGALRVMPPAVEQTIQPGDVLLGVGGIDTSEDASLWSQIDDVPPAMTQDWLVERDARRLTALGPDPQPAVIGNVVPRTPAARAGLKRDDVILAANGDEITRFTQLPALIQKNPEPVTLTVWSPETGTARDVLLEPVMQDVPVADGYESRPMIGIIAGAPFEFATRPTSLGEAVRLGAQRTWSVIGMSVQGIGAIVTGEISRCNLGGAISIAQSTGHAARAGLVDFINWIALLSAAIGFLNLLPIPVLDGGHLAFYAYEAVTGRPPPARFAQVLMAIGLSLVVGLMLFGLSNDLSCP